MKLLTKEIERKLIKNHESMPENCKPVVKLFTPDAQCTWLLQDMDPETRIAFGLCDLGHGMPELGYVSLEELASVRGRMGLPVERDRHTKFDKPMTYYFERALELGYISTT